MTEQGKKEYEKLLKQGKNWNKQRALNENRAIEIFWKNYKPTKIPDDW